MSPHNCIAQRPGVPV